LRGATRECKCGNDRDTCCDYSGKNLRHLEPLDGTLLVVVVYDIPQHCFAHSTRKNRENLGISRGCCQSAKVS
jgi:hypothetical protein